MLTDITKKIRSFRKVCYSSKCMLPQRTCKTFIVIILYMSRAHLKLVEIKLKQNPSDPPKSSALTTAQAATMLQDSKSCPFNCVMCDKTFTDASNLHIHTTYKHNVILNQPVFILFENINWDQTWSNRNLL